MQVRIDTVLEQKLFEIFLSNRFVFHKKWKCQMSSRNKTAGRNCTNCVAFVDIKIKRVTKATQRSDPFLNRAIPLAAVVRLHEEHNHGLDCADGLRLLRSTPDTRAAFFDYFKSRMTPAGALSLHRENLGAQEDGGSLLANGALNPSPNTVYHWFRIRKRANYGEGLVDPLSKLAEKAPSHLQNGKLSALTVNRYA